MGIEASYPTHPTKSVHAESPLGKKAAQIRTVNETVAIDVRDASLEPPFGKHQAKIRTINDSIQIQIAITITLRWELS